jgi:hypothetical protein
MNLAADSALGLPSSVSDLRQVPLAGLPRTTDADALRRIVPTADSSRVPVAVFNASL